MHLLLDAISNAMAETVWLALCVDWQVDGLPITLCDFNCQLLRMLLITRGPILTVLTVLATTRGLARDAKYVYTVHRFVAHSSSSDYGPRRQHCVLEDGDEALLDDVALLLPVGL
eukprot:scaffold51996_cov35-Prasinocladus_malaysianus.AAC.1